eukprot:scaffold15234_cov31-Tisochrysis_lutea.AAC.5
MADGCTSMDNKMSTTTSTTDGGFSSLSLPSSGSPPTSRDVLPFSRVSFPFEADLARPPFASPLVDPAGSSPKRCRSCTTQAGNSEMADAAAAGCERSCKDKWWASISMAKNCLWTTPASLPLTAVRRERSCAINFNASFRTRELASLSDCHA